jgi:hypothetical protein
MKYRITSNSRLKFMNHLPYLLILLATFLTLYFKPVFWQYQGDLKGAELNLKSHEKLIAAEYSDRNWYDNIKVGFPLFNQKGVDLYLAEFIKKVFPLDSSAIFFLLLGGLGIYFILTFFKYPLYLALAAALLFSMSFYYFSFFLAGRADTLRFTGTIPWIIFLVLYLKERRSLLSCGLLSLALIVAYKNIVPGLILSIIALFVLYWLYIIISSIINKDYNSLFIITFMLLTAQVIALAAISYPSFYLIELRKHTISDILNISIMKILLIYFNLLLIFLWGSFVKKGWDSCGDKESNFFQNLKNMLTICLILVITAIVMRFYFDLLFVKEAYIFFLLTLIIQGFLLTLLHKRLISRLIFRLVFLLVLGICLIFSLAQSIKSLRPAIEDSVPVEKSISDNYFAEDHSIFRIYPPGTEFLNNQWGVHNQTIGGKYLYGLKRYYEVIEFCLNTELQNRVPINWNVINMLNVKYLIYKNRIHTDNLQYSSYDLENKHIIYRNISSLPRAWFVNEVLSLNTKTEILKHLNSGMFDPSITAIVEKNLDFLEKPDNEEVKIASISADYLQISTRNDSTSLLVISEIYYPGNSSWKAYVDDFEVQIYPVNYILRGIVVPAGEHKIIIKYQLQELPILLLINIIALILTLLLILIGIYHYIRKNYKGEIVYVIKK